MRLFLLPQTLDAPSAYRLFFPARELRAHGWQVLMPRVVEHDGCDDEIVLDGGLPDADVYVLHQRGEPEWTEWIRMLQARGKVVVVDTDDLYAQLPSYHPARRNLSPFVTGTIRDVEGRAVARAKKRRQVTVESLQATYPVADCLTVSTPYLAKAYARKARRVEVLPNRLDWSMWDSVKPQFEAERDRVRVGWMGVAKWRRGDLAVLRRWLRPWLEEHPNVDFVAAGDPSVHDLLDVPHAQRLSFAGVSFRSGRLPKITATMDVGLVPLERNPFNEAKSALKGMEYAACGIPCAATPTAEYRRFVDDGVTGVLADGPKEWRAALDMLVEDHEARRAMGRAARERARQHTIEEHWHEWDRLYRSLVDGAGSGAAGGGAEAAGARAAA